MKGDDSIMRVFTANTRREFSNGLPIQPHTEIRFDRVRFDIRGIPWGGFDWLTGMSVKFERED